jgi:hypothetical protein
VSFNVWSVRGTWFWSLFYPDRHGGAIGAAASEAEAVWEAQAAIERLAQLRDESGIAETHCDDSRVAARLRNSKDSQFPAGLQVDNASSDFSRVRASRTQNSQMRTIGESYNKLWRLTLLQYAARVAAA